MRETLIEFAPNQTIPAMTRATYERILKSDNPVDLASLYTFYCYTIGWQGTNQIRATDGFVAHALKSSREYVAKHRKALEDLGLVKLVQENAGGKFEKCYVRVFYVATTAVGISDTAPDDRCRNSPVAVKTSTNACVLGNGNALELQQDFLAEKQSVEERSSKDISSDKNKDINNKRGEKRNKQEKFDASSYPIPPQLDTPGFRSAWIDFVRSRAQMRKPLTEIAAKLNMRHMAEWGVDRAIAAMEHSARSGWAGLFEPRSLPAPTSPVAASPAKTAMERQLSEKEKRDAYQRDLEARMLKQGGAK